MTVRELREAIANLPDEGEVFIQRIEDFYFEKNGWPVKKIEGEHYHNVINHMKEYNCLDPEYAEQYKEQYIDTHCCINYDKVNLYITSHY